MPTLENIDLNGFDFDAEIMPQGDDGNMHSLSNQSPSATSSFSKTQDDSNLTERRKFFNKSMQSLIDSFAKSRGPFNLVLDNVIKIDPTFKRMLESHPAIEMEYQKRKFKNQTKSKLRIHQFQEDGSFRHVNDCKPYSMSDILHQQRIILAYEYQKSFHNNLNESHKKMKVKEITEQFSNIVGQNLHSRTVSEIRLELQKYSLKLSGRKGALVSRLVQFFDNQTQNNIHELDQCDFSSLSTSEYFDSEFTFSSQETQPHSFQSMCTNENKCHPGIVDLPFTLDSNAEKSPPIEEINKVPLSNAEPASDNCEMVCNSEEELMKECMNPEALQNIRSKQKPNVRNLIDFFQNPQSF